jgi:hypothetical protein
LNFSFNIAKGRIAYYFDQAAAGAPDITMRLLVAAGLQADGTLADYTTMSALLAASNDEATFTGYAAKTLGSPRSQIDNTNDRVVVDNTAATTVTWSPAGGAVNNDLRKALICYVPAPGTSTDAAIIPLLAYDISAVTDGNPLVITINASGLAIIRNP